MRIGLCGAIRLAKLGSCPRDSGRIAELRTISPLSTGRNTHPTLGIDPAGGHKEWVIGTKHPAFFGRKGSQRTDLRRQAMMLRSTGGARTVFGPARVSNPIVSQDRTSRFENGAGRSGVCLTQPRCRCLRTSRSEGRDKVPGPRRAATSHREAHRLTVRLPARPKRMPRRTKVRHGASGGLEVRAPAWGQDRWGRATPERARKDGQGGRKPSGGRRT